MNPPKQTLRTAVPAANDPHEAAAVVERPDGYYWLSGDGSDAVGPFENPALAAADRDAAEAEAPEPGETLQEAEDEIGIHGWLDLETGEPAEGQSPPHLDSE